jgi:hypothetical protein
MGPLECYYAQEIELWLHTRAGELFGNAYMQQPLLKMLSVVSGNRVSILGIAKSSGRNDSLVAEKDSAQAYVKALHRSF